MAIDEVVVNGATFNPLKRKTPDVKGKKGRGEEESIIEDNQSTNNAREVLDLRHRADQLLHCYRRPVQIRTIEYTHIFDKNDFAFHLMQN